MRYLFAKLDDDVDVEKRENVIGCATYDESARINTELMTQSQDDAKTVALRRLGYTVTDTGTPRVILDVSCTGPSKGRLMQGDVVTAIDGTPVSNAEQIRPLIQAHRPGTTVRITVDRGGTSTDVSVKAGARDGLGFLGIVTQTMTSERYPLNVQIDTDKVSGPSAGLAFALAIIDDLTPGDLTGGRRVAVTGAIARDGSVTPVGGVAQKAVAARESGAKLMLVPVGEVARRGPMPRGCASCPCARSTTRSPRWSRPAARRSPRRSRPVNSIDVMDDAVPDQSRSDPADEATELGRTIVAQARAIRRRMIQDAEDRRALVMRWKLPQDAASTRPPLLDVEEPDDPDRWPSQTGRNRSPNRRPSRRETEPERPDVAPTAESERSSEAALRSATQRPDRAGPEPPGRRPAPVPEPMSPTRVRRSRLPNRCCRTVAEASPTVIGATRNPATRDEVLYSVLEDLTGRRNECWATSTTSCWTPCVERAATSMRCASSPIRWFTAPRGPPSWTGARRRLRRGRAAGARPPGRVRRAGPAGRGGRRRLVAPLRDRLVATVDATVRDGPYGTTRAAPGRGIGDQRPVPGMAQRRPGAPPGRSPRGGLRPGELRRRPVGGPPALGSGRARSVPRLRRQRARADGEGRGLPDRTSTTSGPPRLPLPHRPG